MVLKANGTQMKSYRAELSARRYGMTDSAFAFAVRAGHESRRATRQSVGDRMGNLRDWKPKRPYRDRVQRNRDRYNAGDPNNRNSSRYLWEPMHCGRFYDN
ncbi:MULTISPECIES: hypothetical protein [Streptomyces]|uniref:Uncharacterized protein n=2 Tax=Streptomyces TaxID=1883 RepID=A0ABV9IL51_9ACTN